MHVVYMRLAQSSIQQQDDSISIMLCELYTMMNIEHVMTYVRLCLLSPIFKIENCVTACERVAVIYMLLFCTSCASGQNDKY